MKSLYNALLILFFAAIAIFSPTKAGAMGSCTWAVVGDSSGCIPSAAHTCPAGQVPNLLDCWGKAQNSCNGVASCISQAESDRIIREEFPRIIVEGTEPELLKKSFPGTERAFGDIEDLAIPGFKFSDLHIGDIFQAAIPLILGVAGILLLLYLLYGGYHLMISGGEPKTIQEAKGKITNAFIGFIIVFVAYWIVQIVAGVFGLSAISEIFG